jgi:hypothetical protein
MLRLTEGTEMPRSRAASLKLSLAATFMKAMTPAKFFPMDIGEVSLKGARQKHRQYPTANPSALANPTVFR